MAPEHEQHDEAAGLVTAPQSGAAKQDFARQVDKVQASLPDNATHVLVVDDDQRIRDLIAIYLRKEGYRVTTAAHVEAARGAMRGLSFDVIVLDIMMPGETGLEFAADLRKTSRIPILMITARAEPTQRVQGLEAGVDDYLAKPFDPRELLIRLSNILKRYEAKSSNAEEIRIGDFVFHLGRGELKRGDEPIKLTERERELLRLFAQRPGATIPRHELIAGDATANERAVDVQINRLRRKIEPDPANPTFLQTVRGRGYILHMQ
jgi:two-component system, OmpR family, phosphate regulon response regulator OmpR